MIRRRLAMTALAALPLLGGCPGGGGAASDGGADTGDTDGGTPADHDGPAPHRDQWRVVHEGPFVELDEDGEPLIRNLIVGNTLGYNDNFVNRGDVIEQFEFRRFTFAASQADAEAVYDRTSLWAYNSSTGTPKRPVDMDEADRCDGLDADGAPRAWKEGCAVYLYYDGQAQLVRAGADIRVTLPPEYRGALALATSDNVAEDDYRNRGNVCVDRLGGAVDIELQNGIALVSIASDSPYPSCPAELVAQCEAYDDPNTDGPDAWSADCPCINLGYNPGLVKVESLEPSSADITVDVPSGLWTSFRAENAGENTLQGKHCPATIEGLAAVEFSAGMADPNKPWLRGGIANEPPAAPAGGYRIDLKSSGCEAVGAVESPADWEPDVVDANPVLRGEIEICDGCLTGTPCDQLLPGG
jgi:hypothetical protein